ncbi:MAG: hypothetical protein R2867_44925 [Caldilineaceae bacterium]
MHCEPLRTAAIAIGQPKVTGIEESNMFVANCWLTNRRVTAGLELLAMARFYFYWIELL